VPARGSRRKARPQSGLGKRSLDFQMPDQKVRYRE
jgi:hypothetical protein